jgi:flagellar hook assembly protein FlgD
VAERTFWLNATLGHLRVSHRVLRVRRRGTAFRIGFRLAAPARVRVMIETSTGVRVRTVSNRFMRAGTRRVVWSGRYGNGVLARRGGYLVRVLATNSYGPTELTQRFSVRRAGR